MVEQNGSPSFAEGCSWQTAASMAARMHKGAFRKDGVTPYIAHPARVALTIAADFGETAPDLLAAALLHDAIEDSDCDHDEISEACGVAVADLVASLTKDRRLPYAVREEAYREQIRKGGWKVKLIKLADVLDNYRDSRTSGTSPESSLRNLRMYLEIARAEPRLEDVVARIRCALPDVCQVQGKSDERMV